MSSALCVNRIQCAVVALAGLVLAAGLAGCASGGSAATAVSTGGSTLPAANGLGGTVYGGSQPIMGATVQLVQVGTSGYGSFGSVLASTTTDGSGKWTLTGAYTCPSSSTLVYVTATGGNPGMPSGTNAQISLMAALGACGPLVATPPTVVINEATTVASVYALAQFMSPTGTVGSYGTNTTGITNAFATVNNLVSTATGAMLTVTPAGNGVVPQNELNTLADILATCVNSPGGAAGSSTPCGSLLTDATPNGGTAPANTLVAALDIALHPAQNVGPLFGLVTTNGPFQPVLSTQPNDWTVALAYSNGMQQGALALAVDGGGNVWTVTNYNGGAALGFVSEISPTGSVSVTNSTYNGGTGVAIDTTGNAWVANGTQVDGYLPNGNSFAGPFTGNGLNSPNAVAIDGNDDLWITSPYNDTVEVLSLSGGAGNYQFTSGNTGYAAGTGNPLSAIAIDESGNAWIVNNTNLTALTSNGIVISGSPFSGAGGASLPGGVAVDGTGDIYYVTNATPNNVLKITHTGASTTSQLLAPAGATGTQAVAVDGAANVWLAGSTLTQMLPNGTAVNPSGYASSSLSQPSAVEIDMAGNVWVADGNATVGTLTTVITEFVGLAAPSVTPLSAALQSRQVGSEPGTPIPVVIASGALPYYTVNSAYQAQLYATGGNSGTYAWSLAPGSAVLPNGLMLSSTGLISGTTTVTSSTTVTLQVADAANSANTTTKSFTLTPIGGLTARGNEAVLTGSYAVLINTFHNNVQSGVAEGTALAGSIVFSGSGTVSGELDYTDKSKTTSQQATFTGYYTYGPDNRGTLVIVPAVSGANAIEFAFSGGTLNGSTPQSLSLIEFDDTNTPGTGHNGQMGTGVARLQTAAAFVPGTLNQTFVFGMQGETPCVLVSGNGCTNTTVTPFGPLSMVGEFSGNNAGTITFGEEDGGGVNTNYTGITMTGAYTNPDTSGRGTLTFSYTGTNVPLAPTHYVYYIVSATEMYLLSADGHATASLLSGDALAQSGTFSTSTLSGNYVGWETAGYNADGVSTYPVAAGAQLLVVTASSAGQLTVLDDQNNAGAVQTEKALGTQTYTIDSTGRVLAGGGNVIFYVVNPSQFFGTEQPASQGPGAGPGLLTFQKQIGSGFSCADLNGAFGLGQVASVVDVPTTSGEVSFTSGAGSVTTDHSEQGVLLQGTTLTSTCSTDSLTASLGRTTATTSTGGPYVVYAITQGQRYVLLDLSNTATPPISMLEK